jgi:hypothetical protein
VRLASTAEEFERQIELELSKVNPEAALKRRAFAKSNTWKKRWAVLASAIRRLKPMATRERGREQATIA